MGENAISFFGSDWVPSGPTAGSVFETNNHDGNFDALLNQPAPSAWPLGRLVGR